MCGAILADPHSAQLGDSYRMSETLFPPGTSVRVRQTVRRRSQSYEAEVVGVVEAWEQLPTGSWHAHGKPGVPGSHESRLWLKRLKLRKLDGEMSYLVIDNGTTIAKLAPAPASDGAGS